MRFSLSFAPLLALAAVVSAQGPVYRVHNNCPEDFELFIAQQSQGTLAKGATLTKTDLGPAAGFFYTWANGGGEKDNMLVSSRAGFFFVPNYWYYYIVRDPDAANFNTGISVVPNAPESNGFCAPAVCLDGNCTTAFTHPPVFNGGPPAANAPAPNPPNFQCKVDPNTVEFDITFCPTGSWP